MQAQSCPTLCDPMDCGCQAPLSMGFPRQEYWNGFSFPIPEDLLSLIYNYFSGLYHFLFRREPSKTRLFNLTSLNRSSLNSSWSWKKSQKSSSSGILNLNLKICDLPPKIWKTQQWSQDWKRSVFIPVPKKGNAKECSNYCTIALISHTSKVMLKILQARLQQYVNHELPDGQAGFRKGRGTRDQIANIHRIIKKAREFQKNIYFCLLTMPKPLTVWITTNCGNS